MAKYNENIPEERIAACEETLSELNHTIRTTITSLKSVPRPSRNRMQQSAATIKTSIHLEEFLEEFPIDAPSGYDPDWDKKVELKEALVQKIALHSSISEAQALIEASKPAPWQFVRASSLPGELHHSPEDRLRSATSTHRLQTPMVEETPSRSHSFTRAAISTRDRSNTVSASHRIPTQQDNADSAALPPEVDAQEQLITALAGLANIDKNQVVSLAEENAFSLPNEHSVRVGLVSLKLRGFLAYNREDDGKASSITVRVNNPGKVIGAYNTGKFHSIGI